MMRILTHHLFAAALGLVVVVVLVQAVADGAALHENFVTKGNDDIMRLMSVRDWLAGQGWYDVAQYRLVPPEGVDLHWSRYIDLGIAAIILPLSMFMSMDMAEQIAVTVFPTLVLLITLCVMGFGTRRVFGTHAAAIALLSTAFWPVTSGLHSSAGNLDHHNLQLLMMALVGFALIWPDKPVRAGLVGGTAAAFSLAIGLESLPFIVWSGLAFLLRALFLDRHQGRPRLISFCLALAVGALALFLGQTPPAQWFATLCDQLGLPTLILIGIAVAACLAPYAIGGSGRSHWVHLVMTGGLVAIGVALAWPVIGTCVTGPYGNLPLSLQETISDRITEARPAHIYAQTHTTAALIFLLPILLAAVLGLGRWLVDRRANADTQKTQALGLLLLLGLFGLAMCFVQMRTVIMAASVVPVIGGVVVARLVAAYLQRRDIAKGLLAIIVAAAMISPISVVKPFLPLFDRDKPESRVATENCRTHAALKALDAVPPGLILTHTNFGPALIWATHHAGLSAPYHRSAAALANGILPFGMEEAEMRAYILRTDATHVLLCRGARYDGDFATALAAGDTVDWLIPVPLDDTPNILLVVDR